MSILESLLNAFWQTAAVSILAWVILRWTPRVNAATREAVWWTVLAFVVLLPVLRDLSAKGPSSRQPASISASAPAPFESEPESVAVERNRRHPATPVELPSGAWSAILLALWCTFCIVQCARLAWSYLHLRRLKQTSRSPSYTQQGNFDAWRLTCGIRRPVRLLISSAVPMPVAIGFQHPAVVLPETLLDHLSAAELDHVLLHELAHIARRDDWSNLLARIAGAILALHPVAAWALRQIRHERELACDDWVVAATGAPRPYAASLARLFELCTSRQRALLASGIADGGSQLGDRIAMLLRRGREFTPQASLLRVSICAAMMFILIVAGARTPAWIAFARPQGPVSAADADKIEKVPRTADPALRNSLLAALVANDYGDLSVDDIIALKVQGVSGEFITGMGRSGLGKLPPGELIDLKVQGVSPGYIHDILALGFGPYTARQIVDFKVQGVPTEFFRALKDSGFLHAGPSEIIEAKVQGLDAGHLREARKYGPNLTLRQIVRLKQAGVL